MFFQGSYVRLGGIRALTFLLGSCLGVSAQSPHSSSVAPLFSYEEVQLTDEAVATSPHAKLFNFGARNGTISPNISCRASPGDQSWPTDDIWDSFDEVIDGALIPTIPLASVCYQNWDNYDAAECARITETWTNPYLHENDPTSGFAPVFQGRTCLPSTNTNGTQCTLGGFPAYSVNVSEVSQIQASVNFARNSNLRPVIKNTGHDYSGKSFGAGGLSIWTHHLKDITFIEHYENELYSGSAFKVGAGVTLQELYQAAEDNEVTVLGGVCESVGFTGGYMQGGGHSPLMSIYGMAADQALSFQIVTADGRFITVSPNENSDLFWALQGGGGGTWGVVTSVIVRAHPKLPVTLSRFSFSTSENVSSNTFWNGIESYFEHYIPFADAGTYSYWSVFPGATNRSLTFTMMSFFAPNHTIESFNYLVKPWFDRLHDLGIPFTPNTTYHESFLSSYKGLFNAGVDPIMLRTGSRLFPRMNWEDDKKFNDTWTAIRNVGEAGNALIGYNLQPANHLNRDNAVATGWRNALSFIITGLSLPDGASPAQVKEASDTLTWDILESWREVAPTSSGAGVYLNEADVMEPDWQDSFYGDYARLSEIKKKYDPWDLFYATTGVGSERWIVEDGEAGVQTQNGRLCRVRGSV